jgi:hypothetical protein
MDINEYLKPQTPNSKKAKRWMNIGLVSGFIFETLCFLIIMVGALMNFD